MRAIGTYPRHAVLAAVTAGLLLGPTAPAAAIAAAAAAAAALSPRRSLALALAAATTLAAFYAGARTRALEHSTLAARTGTQTTGDATILEPPQTTRFGTSARARLHGEIVLLGLRGARPGVGDIVRIRGSVRPAGDYARSQGAHVEIRVADARRIGRRNNPIDPIRRVAAKALAHGLPPPEAALHRGMVLGDDSDLPDDVKQDFRATGLTHLTAASGANIALLAALALAVTQALGLGLTARALTVLALIALYVPLAGSGPSIRRAGIMGAAAAVAILAGRPASRAYALLLAAAGTLALDPRAAADPGWQLSFAAVAALLLRARAWSDRLAARGLQRPLADAVAVTTAATLATAPLIAAHFDRVSLVALPANVLAAPLVAPIMWLGATAIVAEPIMPAAAAALDAVAAYPLACLIALANASAGLPGATLTASPLAVAAACALIVAAIEHRRALAVAVVTCAAAAAVASAAHARHPEPRRPAHLRVTFLDVGQGDATLIEHGGDAILVDTGPPDAPILARLRAAGVSDLELLVVTHADADHAGGAAAVLGALHVDTYLDGSGGRARAPGVRTLAPSVGMRLGIGRMTLRILSPKRGAAGATSNDGAIVAELDADGARVLLPADAESPVTLPLHLIGPVDVLKVAHHGSADPGLPALLAAIRPRIAVISVGAHNPFGHPTLQALGALRAVPTLLRTDQDGSIRLDLTPGGWEVRTPP